MRKEKTTEFGGKSVTVNELTVEQVTNLLDGFDKERAPSTLELLFPDKVPPEAVELSTGLTLEDLEKAAPSEIEALFNAVEEVNSFFAGMIGRLAELGRSALAAGTSKEPA